jgi:hypothetical protein
MNQRRLWIAFESRTAFFESLSRLVPKLVDPGLRRPMGGKVGADDAGDRDHVHKVAQERFAPRSFPS